MEIEKKEEKFKSAIMNNILNKPMRERIKEYKEEKETRNKRIKNVLAKDDTDTYIILPEGEKTYSNIEKRTTKTYERNNSTNGNLS